MTVRQKKTLTLLGIIAAILLIIGMIVVVYRLATLQRVAPTAPESTPRAAEWIGGTACETTFTIAGAPTATPSATPTATSTPTPTPTATPAPSPTPTATPAVTPTGTITITVTPTPTTVTTSGTPTPTASALIACNGSCTANSNCMSGYICNGGVCRNSQCVAESDCSCGFAAATPTPTTVVVSLPEAGISIPTLGVIGGGVIMILLGILLAL